MVKTVIVLFTLAISTALIESKIPKQELTKYLMQNINECVAELNVNRDEFRSLLALTFETRTARCYAACFIKKLGMMKDGKFDPDGLNDIALKMHEEGSMELKKLKDIGEDCEDKISASSTSDECDLAVEIYQCLELGNELS